MMFSPAVVTTGGPAIHDGGVDPTKIPGLVGWWDARYLDLPDGTPVGTLPDLSGNGRDMVQSTTADKPTFKQNLYGRAAVEFDGAGDLLDWVGDASDVKTMIAVYALSQDPVVSGLFARSITTKNTSNSDISFLIYHLSANTEIRLIAYAADRSWQGAIGGNGPGAGVYFWHAGVMRNPGSSALEVWKDGVLVTTASAASYDTADGRIVLGNTANNGNKLALATAMVFDRDLTKSELEYLIHV